MSIKSPSTYDDGLSDLASLILRGVYAILFTCCAITCSFFIYDATNLIIVCLIYLTLGYLSKIFAVIIDSKYIP